MKEAKMELIKFSGQDVIATSTQVPAFNAGSGSVTFASPVEAQKAFDFLLAGREGSTSEIYVFLDSSGIYNYNEVWSIVDGTIVFEEGNAEDFGIEDGTYCGDGWYIFNEESSRGVPFIPCTKSHQHPFN